MSLVTTLLPDLPAVAEYLMEMQGFQTMEAALAAAETGAWHAQAYAYWDAYAAAHPILSGGAAQAVTSATETALEVAQSTSLVATTQEATSVAVSVSERAVAGGATQYGLSAMMAMDVGIVGAAAAPVLGVALGAGLYASNPELWTKISQKLLPFCYPDTTTIPTWVDVAGSTFIVKVTKDVIDALKELFEEEGIDPTLEEVSLDDPSITILQPVPINDSIEFIAFGSPHSFTCTGGKIVLVDTPESYQILHIDWIGNTGDLLYDGGTVGGAAGNGDTLISGTRYFYHIPPISILKNSSYELESGSIYYGDLNTIGQIATVIIDGIIGYPGFPVGTSKWEGVTPSTIPLSDPIIVDEDGNVVDMVPISPPITVPSTWQPGLPAPSGDPTEQPDTGTIYDPATQIQPYLMPLPTPSETINPIPEPADPSNDPSEDTTPPQRYIDIVPMPPVPDGSSPWPSMPTTPSPFSSNVGLVTVYHPTDAQLYSFEQWLWVTYADATIDKIWNNPFDGVITLFELYCTPTDIGTRNIHCGFLDSGVNSAIISRYTEIDCGSLGIPEWYGNYLDYSPYTKAHIYLPFIGIQELNPDDIVGHGVNVTYRIDEYNGSCIAMITVAKSTTVNGEEVEYSNTMYQFSGNCAVELPITGGSQAAIKAGMMQADAYQTAANVTIGTSIMGGLASAGMGSVMGAISGVSSAAGAAAYGQANYLSNMLSGKSTVQKSGSFGASHGALGIKTPFIIITRPKQIQVADYEKLYGYPAHKMVTIGACTGFLRCREVHVISPTASDEEKTLIEQLLKAGVYVTE